MGHYYHPPQPFVGGRQPLAPSELPPSITAVAVNNPPFTHPTRRHVYQALMRSWDPPPPDAFMGQWQPLEPGKLAPALEAVPVNNPPLGQFQTVSSEIYGAIMQSWVPGPPQPPTIRNLPSAVTSVPVNNPPFGQFQSIFQQTYGALIQSWQPPWPGAQGWRYLALGVAVNDPPFASGGRDSRRTQLERAYQWQPGTPLLLSGGFSAQVTDSPIPSNRVQLMAQIVNAWQPPPPLPWPGYQVNPVITAVRVDNPPFGAFATISPETHAAIMQSWAPTAPQPWPGYRVSPIVASVLPDNPPFGQFTTISPETYGALLQSWQPGPAQPYVPKYLVQGAAAAQQGPPPYSTATLLQLVTSWQPGPPQSPVARNLPPAVTAVAVDNPPPSVPWINAVVARWQQDGAPITRRAFVTPSVLVDNPPFGSGKWAPGVLSQWQPGQPFPITIATRMYTPSGAAVIPTLTVDQFFVASGNSRSFIASGKGMSQVSPKRVSEAKTLTFRYAADVAAGVTLSNPVITKACLAGNDPFSAPAAILGVPQIAANGTDILVLFSAGLDGCRYAFLCEAMGSDGQIHDKALVINVRADAAN